MSKIFCSQCGEESDGGDFCNNCGAPIDKSAISRLTDQAPIQATPQYSPQGGYYPPQGMIYHQKSDYERPPNYKFTESILERIVGTLKLDIDVVEEIEDRSDLDSEARILLLANFGILAVLQILSIITFTDIFEVDSMAGMIILVLLTTFLGGIAYIYFIAVIGKTVGGERTQTSMEEILRVLAYGYVASSISQFLVIVIGYNIISLIAIIYSLVVFVFVIRRALDRGYGIAILTIIIAAFGQAIVNEVFSSIVEAIFGGAYTFL